MCEQLLANPLIESYEIVRMRRRLEAPMKERRCRLAGAGADRVVAVVVFPGSNDDQDAAWALGALGAEAEARLARRRGASGRHGRGRPPRRVLVRRLPPLRRDRPLLAGDARRRRVRCRGRAGARDLQRLPDPLRGRPAPGRAPAERVALVRVPRRRGARRARGTPVHVPLRGGPAARHSRQARRGVLVRDPPSSSRSSSAPGRSSSATTRARTRTARSPTSPASSTKRGT